MTYLAAASTHHMIMTSRRKPGSKQQRVATPARDGISAFFKRKRPDSEKVDRIEEIHQTLAEVAPPACQILTELRDDSLKSTPAKRHKPDDSAVQQSTDTISAAVSVKQRITGADPFAAMKTRRLGFTQK